MDKIKMIGGMKVGEITIVITYNKKLNETCITGYTSNGNFIARQLKFKGKLER